MNQVYLTVLEEMETHDNSPKNQHLQTAIQPPPWTNDCLPEKPREPSLSTWLPHFD